jgi:hypothetical protein
MGSGLRSWNGWKGKGVDGIARLRLWPCSDDQPRYSGVERLSNSKFGLEAKEKAVTRSTEVAREDDIQLRKSREGQAVARCSVNGD